MSFALKKKLFLKFISFCLGWVFVVAQVLLELQ